MPYKNPNDKARYDFVYYRALRQKLIEALGERCEHITNECTGAVEICGATEELEVHHLTPYTGRSRPNSRAYFNPKGKELRCKTHHEHTESWRRGAKK